IWVNPFVSDLFGGFGINGHADAGVFRSMAPRLVEFGDFVLGHCFAAPGRYGKRVGVRASGRYFDGYGVWDLCHCIAHHGLSSYSPLSPYSELLVYSASVDYWRIDSNKARDCV